MSKSYEFIVAGGGSAGCVVASRLAMAGRHVLLLEEGPTDRHPFVTMPGAFVRLIGTNRSFLYQAEAAPGLLGRAPIIPQGRMLGGGSSINAMVYMRGQPQDYDSWEAAGCPGWGWQDVLPIFRRAEANELLAGPLHGTEGMLKVSDPRHRHPLSLAFVRAAQQAGLPHNPDFNGESQIGAGFFQTTTFDGRRGSTAATYLTAAEGLANLTVVTGARAERLILDAGRAVGVEARTAAGVQRYHAGTELILAAGALATPKLLMLSGIGDPKALLDAGVDLVHPLPGVGQNYQDHMEVPVQGRTRAPISLLGQDRGLRAMRHGMEYKLFRTGILSSTIVETGAFADTDGDGRADVQFHVLPVLSADAGQVPIEGHGITLNPSFLRPLSRGRIRLRSSHPEDPILLDTGYLSERADVETLMRGVRLARRILRQPAMQALISAELLPSPHENIDDAALEAHVRSHAKTVYHPSGTCKMGADEMAVVGPDLRVHGVEGLRVCDASVMPSLISGNTNAPTIMIAERCADFILGAIGAATTTQTKGAA